MGIIRKTVSVSTLGVGARYRSKDERAAKVAKQTRNAARLTAAGTVANAKYTREIAKRGRPEPVPEPEQPRVTLRSIAGAVQNRYAAPQVEQPPAGWYPDPHQTGADRWWDGEMWTPHNQPTGPPSLY